MTTAGEICCRELVYAMCDTTIHGALQLMRQSHVDAVIVMSTSNVMDGRQRTLGIVSDSDVTSRVYATELDPSVIEKQQKPPHGNADGGKQNVKCDVGGKLHPRQ